MDCVGKTKKLVDEKSIRLLFIICWITYFSTQIGRLNFSASIGNMIQQEGFTKAQLGSVAAAFFFAYGIGQLISGFLGDRISSRNMVFIGLFSSSLINILMGTCTQYQVMTVLWFLNGLVQSMTWSPIARLISERLTGKQCIKACVNLSTTVPVGTLFTYFMCSQLIRLFNWRWVFFVAASLMVTVSILWFIFITKLEKFADASGEVENTENKEVEEGEQNKQALPFLIKGMILIVVAAVLHGVLKDGVMTWVPTYLTETFDTSSSLSIQLTMILPIVNLLGVYASDFFNKKVFKNELLTAALFFGLTVLATLMLNQFGSSNLLVSLILLSIITASMLGVNTMLVSVVPMHFRKYGKVSTVCGILNSATYVGSAASSYGTGATAQHFGWAVTRAGWCILSLLGTIICIVSGRLWRKIRN